MEDNRFCEIRQLSFEFRLGTGLCDAEGGEGNSGCSLVVDREAYFGFAFEVTTYLTTHLS